MSVFPFSPAAQQCSHHAAHRHPERLVPEEFIHSLDSLRRCDTSNMDLVRNYIFSDKLREMFKIYILQLARYADQ